MSISKDLMGAFVWCFRAAAEVALKDGLDEVKFLRLALVSYRWERDGEIPTSDSMPIVALFESTEGGAEQETVRLVKCAAKGCTTSAIESERFCSADCRDATEVRP